MSPWERLLEKPHPGEHYVQLYDADENALCRNVGQYIGKGLRRGDGALIVATSGHRELFCAELEKRGVDLAESVDRKQLLFLDALETLAKFMSGGQPDWERFDAVIRAAIKEVQPVNKAEGLRAYGEMVGILWKRRHYRAAIRLEQLWNRLLERSSISLYCAYAVDIFGREHELANLDSVLRMHTHLVPSEQEGTLEAALNRSMDEILGKDADLLRVKLKAHEGPTATIVAGAESMVLWLRKNLPGKADRIIERAREHYRVAVSD